MKKSIVIILALALSMPIFAQEKEERSTNNEFSIGYGFRPISSGYYGVGSPSHFTYWIDKVGAIYGTYTHYFNKVVGVGGTYCFDPREIDYYYHGVNTINPLVCNLYESSHSIMGHVKINCVNKKHFVLYFKTDAGICLWDYKLKEHQPELFGVNLPQQHCCFAWQVASGIEVGNEHLAGIMQCGIGMEGILCLGIRYKF